MTIETSDDVLCTGLGMQTLVGYLYHTDEWPKKAGNCFSLTVGKESLRIVNFNVANFERLLFLGLVFPFKVRRLAPGVGALHDSRIPAAWYDHEWCTTCCPHYLLPTPQQLAFDRNVELGNIKVLGKAASGSQMTSYKMPFVEPVLPDPP